MIASSRTSPQRAPESSSGDRLNFPTLYFEATRGCNLRCGICMTGSNDSQRVRQSKREELSTDEIEELVLKTALERRGIPHAQGFAGVAPARAQARIPFERLQQRRQTGPAAFARTQGGRR